MRFLLDTNTCIAAMRQHPRVVQQMAAVPPQDCVISTITSYELFTGVEKCANPGNERAKVQLLLQTVSEIPFDSKSAREAARIRSLLESQGAIDWPLRSAFGWAGKLGFPSSRYRKHRRIQPCSRFEDGELGGLIRHEGL